MNMKLGDRVTTLRDIDHWPYTAIMRGELGTVTCIRGDVIHVKLDRRHPGLVPFDNEITVDGDCENVAELLAVSSKCALGNTALCLFWLLVPLGLAMLASYALGIALPGQVPSAPFMLAVAATAVVGGSDLAVAQSLLSPVAYSLIPAHQHTPGNVMFAIVAVYIAMALILPWLVSHLQQVRGLRRLL